MDKLFFFTSGHARFAPMAMAAFLLGLAIALRTRFGIWVLDAKDLLALVVPIAGTFVALALPAAQLAQSVLERFYSVAQDLAKSDEPAQDVAKYLAQTTTEQRRDLESIRGVIYFSVASLALGLTAALAPSTPLKFADCSLSLRDLLAATALTSLVAAVGWLLPVIQTSFNLAKADQIANVLNMVPAAATDAAVATTAGPSTPTQAEP